MFDSSKLCPLLGEPCIQNKCQFFIHLQGQNPNTGLATDESGCAIAWLPVLLVENAQKVNQASGEVSELRKEVRNGQSASVKLMNAHIQRLGHDR